MGVHHLRLDPDAEAHAQLMDHIDERFQPVGKLDGIDHQSPRPSVIPPFGSGLRRPNQPFVHHEQFCTDLGCPMGQCDLPVAGHREVRGLPRVVQHRPRGGVQQRAPVVVEGLAERVEAVRGVGGHNCGCGEAVTGRQTDREVRVVIPSWTSVWPYCACSTTVFVFPLKANAIPQTRPLVSAACRLNTANGLW